MNFRFVDDLVGSSPEAPQKYRLKNKNIQKKYSAKTIKTFFKI